MKLLIGLLAFGAGIYFAEWRHRNANPADDATEDPKPAVVEVSAPPVAPAATPGRAVIAAAAPAAVPPAPKLAATPAPQPAPRQTTYFSAPGGSSSAVGGGTVPAIPLTNLGDGETARKFRVTIVGTSSDGVVATGRFLDRDPGVLPKYRNPLDKSASDWKITGAIVIRGLRGVVDGQEWSGMLERDGVATYHVPYHGDRTVAAYRVSDVPEPKPDPKAWMWGG